VCGNAQPSRWPGADRADVAFSSRKSTRDDGHGESRGRGRISSTPRAVHATGMFSRIVFYKNVYGVYTPVLHNAALFFTRRLRLFRPCCTPLGRLPLAVGSTSSGSGGDIGASSSGSHLLALTAGLPGPRPTRLPFGACGTWSRHTNECSSDIYLPSSSLIGDPEAVAWLRAARCTGTRPHRASQAAIASTAPLHRTPPFQAANTKALLVLSGR
jgi:hypothetical protein